MSAETLFRVAFAVSTRDNKWRYFENAVDASDEAERLARIVGTSPVKNFGCWYEGTADGKLLVRVEMGTFAVVEMPKCNLCSGPPTM